MNQNEIRNNLRETYNKYAQQRDTSTMQEWRLEERSEFLSLLQTEQKKTLLEIGAGTGRDSKFFHDQGMDVVCIDLSPAMVELCEQKGLTAYVMDMTNIQFPAGSFDAVYAMNSLLHLSKAEFPSVLQGIDRLLKPDGLVFLGIYGGPDYEGIWEEDRYTPKRFFSFFTDERLQQEATKAFDVISFKSIQTEPQDTLHFQRLLLKKKSAALQAQ